MKRARHIGVGSGLIVAYVSWIVGVAVPLAAGTALGLQYLRGKSDASDPGVGAGILEIFGLLVGVLVAGPIAVRVALRLAGHGRGAASGALCLPFGVVLLLAAGIAAGTGARMLAVRFPHGTMPIGAPTSSH